MLVTTTTCTILLILLKNVCNNLYKYSICYDDQKTASWANIRNFFKIDQKQRFRLAPKLTSRHLELPAFSQMKVKLVPCRSALLSIRKAMWASVCFDVRQCGTRSKHSNENCRWVAENSISRTLSRFNFRKRNSSICSFECDYITLSNCTTAKLNNLVRKKNKKNCKNYSICDDHYHLLAVLRKHSIWKDHDFVRCCCIRLFVWCMRKKFSSGSDHRPTLLACLYCAVRFNVQCRPTHCVSLCVSQFSVHNKM